MSALENLELEKAIGDLLKRKPAEFNEVQSEQFTDWELSSCIMTLAQNTNPCDVIELLEVFISNFSHGKHYREKMRLYGKIYRLFFYLSTVPKELLLEIECINKLKKYFPGFLLNSVGTTANEKGFSPVFSIILVALNEIVLPKEPKHTNTNTNTNRKEIFIDVLEAIKYYVLHGKKSKATLIEAYSVFNTKFQEKYPGISIAPLKTKALKYQNEVQAKEAKAKAQAKEAKAKAKAKAKEAKAKAKVGADLVLLLQDIATYTVEPNTGTVDAATMIVPAPVAIPTAEEIVKSTWGNFGTFLPMRPHNSVYQCDDAEPPAKIQRREEDEYEYLRYGL